MRSRAAAVAQCHADDFVIDASDPARYEYEPRCLNHELIIDAQPVCKVVSRWTA